jgi:hypothetical protein
MQRAVEGNSKAFGALGLSIASIQGLAPDEQFARIAEALDAVTDPAEKTALAMEVFGRSGRDAINMLTDYRAKVADAEAFQRRFGITVSQVASDNIEAANDAVGRLGQVFTGLGNQLAGYVAPAIERTANALISLADAVVGLPSAVERVAAAFEPVVIVTDEVIFGLERFRDALIVAGNEGAGQGIQAIIDAMKEADRLFKEGEISADEFAARILATKEEADRLIASLSTADQAQFTNVISRLGQLWGALNVAANEAARLRSEMADGFEIVDPGMTIGPGEGTFVPDPNAPTNRPRRPGIDSIPATGFGGRSGGGGGGGLADQLATRLETLMEGLATEAETVAAWYEEQNATLEEALAAKLLTETEYMDARERLEQEHQERLNSIAGTGANSRLEITTGLLGQLADLVKSGGKKMLGIYKASATAEAAVSGYQAAVDAWQKGMRAGGPGLAAAFAGLSLARTGALIAKINATNSGGGAGGTGGGGGATAAQPAAPPVQRVLIDYAGPASFMPSLEGLVDMLNQAGRRGMVLDARITGRG